MSLIRLANGHKYEIEQPNEGEGMMRNRRRTPSKPRPKSRLLQGFSRLYCVT